MSVETSLRKSSWLLPLPLIAAAALLNAQAATQLLGVALAPDAQQLSRPPPVSMGIQAIPSSSRTPSARSILERNPFDHLTGSLIQPTSDATPGDAPLETGEPLDAPPCEGLDVSAIVASGEEDWSFAAMRGPDHKAHLLRRGGEIASKRVHFVGRDRVWFADGSTLCQVRVHDAKKAPSTPTPAAPVASASPQGSARARGAPLDADLKKGIQAVSATEFNIDRGVVDKILENQAALMRQARVVPVQENGRVVGVRLLGIRPDGLLGVLGMQNGDTLRTINGFDMGSPEKALEAYARLRTADRLTIQLGRGGKNMNLDYNIK